MDQDFNLWQKLFQSKPVMRATGGLRYLLGNEQEKNQLSDLWGEDVDNSLPAIMGLTKPFRMGANILGQYYGSALSGKDMTQQENQGKFLQWLSSSLTPEEQTLMEKEPYEQAKKSSAGMVSALMPWAKIGVLGKVGGSIANPAVSKFVSLLARGSTEGLFSGYGYSREGKELRDTLLGMGLGAGGEVLGGLISDPTFRRGMGQEIKRAKSGNYEAMLKMGDDGVDDIVYDLGFDGNSETIDMYPASNMREDRFKPVGQIHFSVDEGAGIGTIDDIYVDSMYRRKGLATNALKKLRAEYPDIKFTTTLQTDDGSALFNSPEVRKILGTDTGTKPPANIGSLADDADNVIDLTKDKLYLEAKKYDTPEEFIKKNQPRSITGKDFLGRRLYKAKLSDIVPADEVLTEKYPMAKNAEIVLSDGKDTYFVKGTENRPRITLGKNLWKNSETGGRELTEEGMRAIEHELTHSVQKGTTDLSSDPVEYLLSDIEREARSSEGSIFKTKSQLRDLWEQAHTQYVGEKPKGKRGRFIDILTGEEGDENQMHRLDYKGLKKEPGRISKTPEEDFREELRKTAERWGLYR